MTVTIGRRDLLVALGGAAAAWPLGARAQQAKVPVVGFINAGVADTSARRVAAFRKGLSEAGYAEGQNVIVEYHWLEGRYERAPSVVADLVRRRVAVIATPASTEAALAAKTATAGKKIDPGRVTAWSREARNDAQHHRVLTYAEHNRDRIPASYVSREMVEAGLLMSYGANLVDTFRQVGIYTGSILKTTKPADLPVLQSTKFEFVLNLQTARSLNLDIPPMLLARADEVIE